MTGHRFRDEQLERQFEDRFTNKKVNNGTNIPIGCLFGIGREGGIV
jgi:hypothetical protein